MKILKLAVILTLLQSFRELDFDNFWELSNSEELAKTKIASNDEPPNINFQSKYKVGPPMTNFIN